MLPPAVIVTVTFRPVTRGCGLEQNCHYVGPFCALLTPQCEVRTWSHEARLTPGSLPGAPHSTRQMSLPQTAIFGCRKNTFYALITAW